MQQPLCHSDHKLLNQLATQGHRNLVGPTPIQTLFGAPPFPVLGVLPKSLCAQKFVCLKTAEIQIFLRFAACVSCSVCLPKKSLCASEKKSLYT